MKEIDAGKQNEKLQEITKAMIGSFTSLTLTDALNRIHLITNLNYSRCIKGLKMMLSTGMIKADFITNLHELEAMEKVTDRVMPIIETMQAEIVKPGTFESLGTVTQVVSADGPTDDPDEGWQEQSLPGITQSKATTRPDLSHLNANF